MARFLTTRFESARPVPLRGGVSLHTVEYHHIDPDERNDGWRTVTLLMNFGDDLVARNTFDALRYAFTSARSSSHVFDGGDGLNRMRRHMESMTFDSLDIVIFAEKFAEPTPNTLAEIVESIPAGALGLVVVVSHDCGSWKTMHGISGFVRGAALTTPATALSVFLLLAALGAPHTLTCLDHEDVRASLGSAQQPALFFEAIWMRDANQLVFRRPSDKLAIRHSANVSCHLMAADLSTAEMSAIMSAVREKVDPNCNLCFQAPFDALVGPYLHQSIGLVHMICRSPTVDSCADTVSDGANGPE